MPLPPGGPCGRRGTHAPPANHEPGTNEPRTTNHEPEPGTNGPSAICPTPIAPFYAYPSHHLPPAAAPAAPRLANLSTPNASTSSLPRLAARPSATISAISSPVPGPLSTPQHVWPVARKAPPTPGTGPMTGRESGAQGR